MKSAANPVPPSNPRPRRPPRPAGTGRKARAKRRREARRNGGGSRESSFSCLLTAPWLRGNTAPGRLRGLDESLATMFPALFRGASEAGGECNCACWDGFRTERSRGDASTTAVVVAVDVGIGDRPDTTMELAETLSPNVCSSVIGTDVDAGRLDEARRRRRGNEPSRSPPVDFRPMTTDFVLPFRNSETPFLVRAMNVLRDYHVHDASVALRKLHSQLSIGGALVEGSSSASGHVLVALMLLRRGLTSSREEEEGRLYAEAVIFASDLEAIDEDEELLGVLPSRWFRRHLRCCDEMEDSRNATCRDLEASHSSQSQSRMPWANSVRNFMQTWSDAELNDPNKPRGIAKNRFVRSVELLSSRLNVCRDDDKAIFADDRRISNGCICISSIDRGILIWKPEGSSVFVPDATDLGVPPTIFDAEKRK